MYLGPERKQLRMEEYDYSEGGWYFVTICTSKRKIHFGEIRNNLMCLNEFGTIVCKQWLWLQKQYPYIRLDLWVVMPNHFHGIIEITHGKDNPRIVQGNGHPIAHTTNTPEYQRRHNTLSQTINAFKTTSSKYIHLAKNFDFRWQRSFHDEIIEDESHLNNARRYILNNPRRWWRDRNNGNHMAGHDEDNPRIVLQEGLHRQLQNLFRQINQNPYKNR